MKAPATFYRGISFIRIHDLPSDQQVFLKSSPNYPERIKLLIDGKILDQCILYAEYIEWFVNVYKQVQEQGTLENTQQETRPAKVIKQSR
jgi:hypothetical protein